MSNNKQQAVAKKIRELLREELMTRTPGAKRIVGFDVHYVGSNRAPRIGADGQEQVLAFAGSPYTTIYTNAVEAKMLAGENRAFTTTAVRKAWEVVEATYFPDGRINVDGIDHILIDPIFRDDGRIQYGHTGLTLPAFASA